MPYSGRDKPTMQKISVDEIYGTNHQSNLSGNNARRPSSRSNTKNSALSGAKSRTGNSQRSRSDSRDTKGSRAATRQTRNRQQKSTARTSRNSNAKHRKSSTSNIRVGTSYNSAKPATSLYAPKKKQKRSSTAPKGSARSSAVGILGVIAVVFGSIGKALSAFFKAIFSHKVGRIVAIVVIAIAVIGIYDTASNWDKAFGNVKVGTVDVSGMTHDEIVSAVKSEYDTKLQTKTAYMYVDDSVVEYVKDEAAKAEDAAQAEQISVEQARNENKLWTATQTSVGATIPYDQIADEALAVGRDNGGIATRISTFFLGSNIAVTVNYDDNLIDSLGNQIDATIGDARIDASVSIKDGWASVIEPHDGLMVNRTTLKNNLTSIFTGENTNGYFIPIAESAPSRTTRDEAASRADAINQAIRYGAKFNYESISWYADATHLGEMVFCGVREVDGAYKLVTWIDGPTAKQMIMKNVAQASTEGIVDISFTKDASGAITVGTSGNSNAPDVAQGATDLNTALFGENGTAWSAIAPTQPVEVELGNSTVPESMSLDDALALGIVSVIGTYTTEYSTYSGTENRNFNIHLAADHINNSIVKANGGEWSFNDTAGFCNEEAGFKSAGIILDGEYTDSIGGGICQVATTVFNAVYEAGLPVTQRSNHSLYIASYPAGRDAAVSYPDLDLKWQNDLSSDVLLRTSYTDSTLTVTLYGVATGYTIETYTSEWTTGENYKVEQKVDESLASGTQYVSTTGVPASSISVTRTVRNKDGEVISTQVFSSSYDAKNCVVTTGPDTTIDESKYKSDETVDLNSVRY